MTGFVTLSRPRPVFNVRPAMPVVPFERVGRLPPRPKPLPTVDELLAKFSLVYSTEPPARLSLVMILDAVSAAFRISSNEIRSQRKAATLTRARFAFCFLARELTSKSFPDIGRFLEGRDHTTVMHAANRCKAIMDSDADYRLKLFAIRATLEARA